VKLGAQEIRRRGCLFIVSGPSGAGKTSICTPVLRELPDIELSVSYTTRRPRAGERDGVDYRFVDSATFDRMIAGGEFAEWAEVHGNRYGTAKVAVDAALATGKDLLLDIDTQGAEQIKRHYSYPKAVAVFLLPPSRERLASRLVGRATEDDESVRTRLTNACREIAAVGRYDYATINEDLETAVEALMSIIRGERLRVANIVDEDLARIVHAFEPAS
jgi:guanylate kinase